MIRTTRSHWLARVYTRRARAVKTGPHVQSYCRSANKWRVQACQRGAFVRLIGPNSDPPVWDCPAFGATTITPERKPSGALQTHALRISSRNVDDSEWTAITVSIGGVGRNPAVRDTCPRIRVLRFRISTRSARLLRWLETVFTLPSAQPRAESHSAGQTQPSVCTSPHRSPARPQPPCALSRLRLPSALLCRKRGGGAGGGGGGAPTVVFVTLVNYHVSSDRQ